MTNMFSRKIPALVIGASLVAEPLTVMAQIEEVLVSARKREESILKVPTTASVLSQEALDQYGVADIKGIADKVPGLNFSSGPLSSGVLVSLRGVGTGTNNPAIDQSVALVADGVQFTQGLAFGAATFDLAQVEVLKGPQALFFGKAAPAGVIAVKTADPSDEAEISLRIGYEFEAEEQVGELIVSGPVTDTLGLRLAAQVSDMDGYMQNSAEPTQVVGIGASLGDMGAASVRQKDFPSKETLLLRGTALWNPADNFSARLKLNYADVDTQGIGGEPQLVSCPDGTGSVFAGLGLTFIGGEDCKADDKQDFVYMDPASYPGIYNNGVPFSDMQQYFGSLELAYDFGNDLTLTSVTGYYDVEQDSLINVSLTTQLGTPFVVQGSLERDDFTQELRLTSNYTTPVNFMIGAFYQKGNTDYLSGLPANQTYNDFIALLDILQPDPDGPRPGLPPALGWADHNVEAETVSAFGQILWDITPEFELGVGARWTNEDRKHQVMNRLFERFNLGPGVALPVRLANPEIGSSTWSPEISLTYTPTDDLTVYANLKRAYKSGSFDVGGAAEDGDDKSFDDEEVNGGELGVKMRGMDGNLSVNAAAYYYKYKDMQLETRVFDPANGVVAIRTTNAASAEIYGVDVDAVYAIPKVEGLTVYGAINWNIAEYDRFDDAQCWTGQTLAEGCNLDFDGDGIGDAQDLSGEPLLRAPEWMANLGFDYIRPVFGDMTLRFGTNTTYSSSYSASSTNYDGYQKDYVKTSATIGLLGTDDRWVVEVIGDNLTDEFVYGNCAPAPYADTLLFGQDLAGTGTTGGPGGQPENACFVERGRSVLLRMTINFI